MNVQKKWKKKLMTIQFFIFHLYFYFFSFFPDIRWCVGKLDRECKDEIFFSYWIFKWSKRTKKKEHSNKSHEHYCFFLVSVHFHAMYYLFLKIPIIHWHLSISKHWSINQLINIVGIENQYGKKKFIIIGHQHHINIQSDFVTIQTQYTVVHRLICSIETK